jgi:hypothetical protein
LGTVPTTISLDIKTRQKSAASADGEAGVTRLTPRSPFGPVGRPLVYDEHRGGRVIRIGLSDAADRPANVLYLPIALGQSQELVFGAVAAQTNARQLEIVLCEAISHLQDIFDGEVT